MRQAPNFQFVGTRSFLNISGKHLDGGNNCWEVWPVFGWIFSVSFQYRHQPGPTESIRQPILQNTRKSKAGQNTFQAIFFFLTRKRSFYLTWLSDRSVEFSLPNFDEIVALFDVTFPLRFLSEEIVLSCILFDFRTLTKGGGGCKSETYIG